MNNGTFTSAPVSVLAGFNVLVAVFPFSPGSVNSIFNLISIIRYNFKNSIEEKFYPFKIKSADLNLFYNVQIYK